MKKQQREEQVAACYSVMISKQIQIAGSVLGWMAFLGTRREWSMDTHRAIAESLALLAEELGLPAIGGQSSDDLAFWRKVAADIGVEAPEEG